MPSDQQAEISVPRGQGPCPASHSTPTRGEHTREQLAGRLRPNPPQVASKAARRGRPGPGRKRGPPAPPRPGSARALGGSPSARPCPSRAAVLAKPLPSHDSGGGRAHSGKGAVTSLTRPSGAWLPLHPPLPRPGQRFSQGRWQEGGSALTEEGLGSLLLGASSRGWCVSQGAEENTLSTQVPIVQAALPPDPPSGSELETYTQQQKRYIRKKENT